MSGGGLGAVPRAYQAALMDLGPLQGHSDAVEEDEGQHHIVKELMGNDGLTELSEPAKTRKEGEREREGETDKEKMREIYLSIST